MLTWSYTAGSDVSETIRLVDRQGDTITTFASGATLTVRLHRGDDQAALSLSTLAASWVDAAAGTVKIVLGASDSATLGAGDYPVRLAITASGVRSEPPPIAVLRIIAAPGAATPRPTRCTKDDVDRVIGDLGAIADDSDQTGYLEQRADARVEFDRIVQRHYRRGWSNFYTTLDHMLDGGARYIRRGNDDTTLQAWLDADRLILTGPSGLSVVRWHAMWAAALILDRQFGRTRDETSYQSHAARLRQRCDDLAATLTVMIDTTTTPDGVGDLTIELSCADVLRG